MTVSPQGDVLEVASGCRGVEEVCSPVFLLGRRALPWFCFCSPTPSWMENRSVAGFGVRLVEFD